MAIPFPRDLLFLYICPAGICFQSCACLTMSVIFLSALLLARSILLCCRLWRGRSELPVRLLSLATPGLLMVATCFLAC